MIDQDRATEDTMSMSSMAIKKTETLEDMVERLSLVIYSLDNLVSGRNRADEGIDKSTTPQDRISIVKNRILELIEISRRVESRLKEL